MYPRPVFVAAAVLDFFPIEGTRRTFREVAAIYRRFGHADRIAMTEGYHAHDFSEENQAAAFAFLDRFNGMPAQAGVASTTSLDDQALRCTSTGQVLLDHADGRSLMDEIRDYYRARADRPQGTPCRRVLRTGLSGYRALARDLLRPLAGGRASDPWKPQAPPLLMASRSTMRAPP